MTPGPPYEPAEKVPCRYRKAAAGLGTERVPDDCRLFPNFQTREKTLFYPFFTPSGQQSRLILFPFISVLFLCRTLYHLEKSRPAACPRVWFPLGCISSHQVSFPRPYH